MKIKMSQYAFKSIVLCIISVLSVFSCSNDDTSSNELNKKLAQQISSDELFVEMNKESRDFIMTIKSRIKEKKLYGNNKIKSIESIDELNCILDLPDNYLLNNYESISGKSRMLFDKYQLNTKNENEILGIFEELYQHERSPYKMVNRLKSGSCEEVFAEQFNEIHEAYDRQVWLCLLAAGFGGPTTLIACNAMNVYNTYYQIALAIDQYYACIGNQ